MLKQSVLGLQVHTSTQSTDHVQWAVAQVLALPHNRVNVTCRRAGGGFGGKFTRSCPVAAAAALAAHKLRRQVRACLLLGRRGQRCCQDCSC